MAGPACTHSSVGRCAASGLGGQSINQFAEFLLIDLIDLTAEMASEFGTLVLLEHGAQFLRSEQRQCSKASLTAAGAVKPHRLHRLTVGDGLGVEIREDLPE